jgi:hypothetical protein
MPRNLVRRLSSVKKLDNDKMASYLSIVHIKAAPPRAVANSKVCVMSLAVANFEQFMDRVAPAVLLVLALASAAAIAVVGG